MSETSTRGIGRRLLEAWLAIAARFGEVQTLVLVTGVYLFAVGPIGTGAALARRDLLHKRGLGEPGSAWNEADSVAHPDMARAKRLF